MGADGWHRGGPSFTVMISFRAAVFFLVAVASIHAGEDRQERLTPLDPGPVPPPRPHKAIYGFGWEGLRAATAQFVFTRVPEKDAFVLEAKARTEGLVRALWALDATMTSTLRASNLRSVETRQHEKYPSKEKYFRLEFLPDRVIERRYETPAEESRTDKRTTRMANILDMHGAFIFLRSLPLKNRDVESIVVYPGSKPYLAKVTVLGREKIKIPAGTFQAIKVKLELWQIGKDLSLRPHTKFKNATAWVSDDADRLLLKVEAGIFVGSVWAELEKIESVSR
jgi:hypothetical protein